MKLDDIKKLHQKKYRTEFGHFLVEGEHLILELEKAAEQNAALQACELFVTETYQTFPSRFKKNLVSEKHMAQLSDTKTPQGIIAVAPILSNENPINKNERAIYLHEIQDPGNLGTILRTLAWFGKFRCLLSPDSVDMHNGKVVRASMGAIFHVPVEVDTPLDALPGRFRRIACLDLKGEPVGSPGFREFDCYLFGNEARGLPPAASADAAVFTIPGTGTIESLNVAATVNICLYELNRK